MPLFSHQDAMETRLRSRSSAGTEGDVDNTPAAAGKENASNSSSSNGKVVPPPALGERKEQTAAAEAAMDKSAETTPSVRAPDADEKEQAAAAWSDEVPVDDATIELMLGRTVTDESAEKEGAQEDAAIVPLQVPVPKRMRKKKVHSDGVNRDDQTLVAHELSALETHSHSILDDIAEGLTLQDVMNISVASKVRNR